MKMADRFASRGRSIICLSLRLWQIIDLLATDKSRYFAQPHPIIVHSLLILQQQYPHDKITVASNQDICDEVCGSKNLPYSNNVRQFLIIVKMQQRSEVLIWGLCDFDIPCAHMNSKTNR